MKSNTIIIILLIFNVFLMGYLYFFNFKEPLAQCLNDPLVYGYKELQSQNNDKLFCSCKLDSKYPSPVMFFDADGRRMEQPLGVGDLIKNNNLILINNMTGSNFSK